MPPKARKPPWYLKKAPPGAKRGPRSPESVLKRQERGAWRRGGVVLRSKHSPAAQARAAGKPLPSSAPAKKLGSTARAESARTAAARQAAGRAAAGSTASASTALGATSKAAAKPQAAGRPARPSQAPERAPRRAAAKKGTAKAKPRPRPKAGGSAGRALSTVRESPSSSSSSSTSPARPLAGRAPQRARTKAEISRDRLVLRSASAVARRARGPSVISERDL